MKKIILYITITFLLAIIISGATYAFFSSTVSTKKITTNSDKFEVIYTGGTDIGGNLTMVNSKEEGKKSTVNIRITEDSIVGLANIYIQIDQITSNLANEALRWEVYKNYNSTESFVSSGNFTYCKSGDTQKKCSSGDKLYLVKDYKLSTTNTAFTIYIWLDGNKATSEVIGGFLKGYIGAETENVTGNLG